MTGKAETQKKNFAQSLTGEINEESVFENAEFESAAKLNAENPVRAEFGLRLSAAMREFGPLCIGIDPHPYILKQWGYTCDAEGAELYSMRMIQASIGKVAAVKFQMPMYECYGSKGFEVLERTLYSARSNNLITIVDCMRGGFVSTLPSVSDTYLKNDSPLCADAITLTPFCGMSSLRGVIDVAMNNGRGVFIASITSNPDGINIQGAVCQQGEYAGHTVASGIVKAVQKLNEGLESMGSVGLVMGATVRKWIKNSDVDTSVFTGPVLSAGYGWQGATAQDLRDIFTGIYDRVLVTVSRSVTAHGPDINKLSDAICATRDEVVSVMHEA